MLDDVALAHPRRAPGRRAPVVQRARPAGRAFAAGRGRARPPPRGRGDHHGLSGRARPGEARLRRQRDHPGERTRAALRAPQGARRRARRGARGASRDRPRQPRPEGERHLGRPSRARDRGSSAAMGRRRRPSSCRLPCGDAPSSSPRSGRIGRARCSKSLAVRTRRGAGQGESAMTVIRSDVVGSLLAAGVAQGRAPAVGGGRARRRAAQAHRGPRGGRGDPLQEDAGLDVVTDGELRRYAFFGHLIEALDGFDKLGGWAIPFHDEQGGELVFKRPVVVEKLRWRRSMCGEEFAYLRARATRPTKVTLISTPAGGRLLRSREVQPAPIRRATPISPTWSTSRGARSRSWSASAARTSRSTRRSTPRCSTPRCARATAQRGSDPDRLIDACIEMDNAVIGRAPGRHVRAAHLPRQQPVDVLRERRLRAHRARVHAEPLRALPARVRRRALGRLRAAARGAGRPQRGARPRDDARSRASSRWTSCGGASRRRPGSCRSSASR